ncbi:hypothetical protein [Paracoccus sp. JM45]|uniref:hypothetical protein n=1 Tax=Paracoccus sp. JM45 TaxID=2283626 RepID=UPI000E6C6E90|nr:hypothetical protein [Paracoccus sp. JM45]RJE79148.1 hypothetical protein DWB67_13890 [Paracoccus sp. JM45]
MNLAAQMKERAATLWHFQRIRRLVRQQEGSGSQAMVSVTQIFCQDPACPGPATQITVMGLDLLRRVVVIHRPLDQVELADIRTAFPN